MVIFLIVFGVLTILVAFMRPDLRKELLWGGLIALPVLLISPLLNYRSGLPVTVPDFALWLEQAGTAFCVGALASVLYKVALRRFITPVAHPNRRPLRLLLAGPALLALSVLILPKHFGSELLFALLLDVILLLVLRSDLFWDFLFSALAMGGLYIILYLFVRGSLPGIDTALWFSTGFTGLTTFGLPIEELLGIFLFGGLWGPLYIAFKGYEEGSPDFHVHHLRPKKVASLTASVLVLGALAWFSQYFVFVPKVEASGLAISNTIAIDAPLTLSFNRPVDRKRLQEAIAPAVDGDWSFTDSSLDNHLFKTVVFTPTSYFLPDTTYTVTLSDITNIAGIGHTQATYTFHTPPLPTVVMASVAANEQALPICSPITVKTTTPDPLASFSFHTTPYVDITVATPTKDTFVVTPKECFGQDGDYSLVADRQIVQKSADGTTIIHQTDPVQIWTTSFHTKVPPSVVTIAPQGSGIVPGSTSSVSITFKNPMDQAQDLAHFVQITPALAGSWQWKSATEGVYTLTNPLATNTAYAVTVSKGLKDVTQGFLTDDTSQSFHTIAPVAVAGISPNGGGVSVGAAIHVTFDQVVDHASAEKAFSVSPALQGSISWSGSTLTYTPSSLSYNTSYSVTVASGVTGTNGLVSISGGHATFSTEESTTLLNIPVYYQQHSLSCEVASTHMALLYKGVNVGEDTLLSSIGFDTTVRNGNIWGDPYAAFVGNVDGHEDTTGYGVYWGPIAAAAGHYRSTQAFSGWSASQVAAQLAAGNPIVFWGVFGGYADPWVTPAGRSISNGWKGEHVRLLVGFTGSVSNPIGFTINDPIVGRVHWTTSQFLANWGHFGNSGVVVY